MHGDLRKFRVVEAGATQLGVIQVETERADQVQARAAVRAKADDVACVRRNFGLVQDDMQHARIIPRPAAAAQLVACNS